MILQCRNRVIQSHQDIHAHRYANLFLKPLQIDEDVERLLDSRGQGKVGGGIVLVEDAANRDCEGYCCVRHATATKDRLPRDGHWLRYTDFNRVAGMDAKVTSHLR